MPKSEKTTRRPPTPAGEAASGALALLANWNYSLAEFSLRRAQRYWQLPLGLLRVTSPSQLAELREAFAAEALADYAAEAEELKSIAEQAGPPLPSAGAGDYEASLLRAQEHAGLIIEQAKAQADHIIASARAQADEMIADGARQAAAENRRAASG